MKLPRFFLMVCLMLAPLLASTEDAATESAEPAPEPEAQVFTSNHEIRIQGQRINYTATAGTLVMRDEEDKAIAEFGYTAYVKQGANPAERPLMFAWNGGPGSASLWLHMGVLGPQRTVVEDLESNGKGPFRRVSNDYSILDKVDLVMVDPVGTGFSSPRVCAR